MTNTPDPGLIVDTTRFVRAMQFFVQDRHSHMGSRIPDDVAKTDVIVGFVPHSKSPQGAVATIPVTALWEWARSGAEIVAKTANTPYEMGSRPEYDVAMAFSTQEEAELFQEILGIFRFASVKLMTLINAGVASDKGICLFGQESLCVTEPDRLNQHIRATNQSYKLTGSPQEMGDIVDHNLRPQEYLQLLNLMEAEETQEWVEQWELGGTTFRGMFTNVLAVVPRPGLTKDEILAKVADLSRKAVEIKTPFAVAPIGRPPVDRGGLGD